MSIAEKFKSLFATMMFVASIVFVDGSANADDVPRFEDYATSPYTGAGRAPDLSSHQDAQTYRTRLRDAAESGVNFAGEYALATWGCGTTCLMGAAINVRTGAVQFLPGTVCCFTDAGESVDPIAFRADSRLIVLTGLLNEEEPMATHYFEMRDGQFRPLGRHAVAAAATTPGSGTTAAQPDQVVLTPRVVPLGKWIEGITHDGRWLWAAESGQRTVARVDLSSGKVSKRFKVGRLPTDMLSMSDGSVFALVATDHIVWRHNKRGRRKKLVWLKGCPEMLRGDGKDLWVVTLPDCSSVSSRLVKVNPRSGRHTKSTVLGEWAQALTTFGGEVWVGHARGPALTIVDKSSLQPRTAAIPGTQVWAMTANGTSVYAGGRLDGTDDDGVIVKLDPATQSETARASVPEMVRKLVGDEEHVIAIGQNGTIWVFAADDLSLLRTISLSSGKYRAGGALLNGDQLLVSASTHSGDNGAVFVLSDWRP